MKSISFDKHFCGLDAQSLCLRFVIIKFCVFSLAILLKLTIQSQVEVLTKIYIKNIKKQIYRVEPDANRNVERTR